jgi:hypothetical protein
MTDITDLFAAVAPAAQEPSPETVDADVARGHRALVRVHRRRLVRRSLVTTLSLAAVAVGVTTTMQHNGSDTTRHGAGVDAAPATHLATPASKRPVVPAARAVRLVAYTGSQLAGFTVDRVPDGWHLSTSTQLALNINRHGDTNNDPDVFEGKLTVLLQSQDAHGLPHGTPVTVAGEPGVVTDQGRYGESLTYNDTSGHTVVVQAPATLAWSDSQIVRFAEGVHVTGDALAGRG